MFISDKHRTDVSDLKLTPSTDGECKQNRKWLAEISVISKHPPMPARGRFTSKDCNLCVHAGKRINTEKCVVNEVYCQLTTQI